MGDPKISNQRATVSNIEIAAEKSTASASTGESRAEVASEQEKMVALVKANPVAAREALTELQRTEVKPGGMNQDAYWKEELGADNQKAIAAIQHALKETPTYESTRRALTAVDIEISAEVSTTGNQGPSSAVHAAQEQERMREVIIANPAAAKKALAELQQKEVKPGGMNQDAYWKEELGADNQKAIAAIQQGLKEAGMSSGKDVSATEVRHSTATAPNANQHER